MSIERTLCIVKPDAVEKRVQGKIIQRLLERAPAERPASLTVVPASALTVAPDAAASLGRAIEAVRIKIYSGPEQSVDWKVELGPPKKPEPAKKDPKKK